MPSKDRIPFRDDSPLSNEEIAKLRAWRAELNETINGREANKQQENGSMPATQEAVNNAQGAMGLNKGSSTDWAPLPEGRYPQYIVESLNVKPATGQYATDKAGNPRYRCVYRFGLPEELAARVKAKAEPKLARGQEQSTSVFSVVGYSWGFLDERAGVFKPSKLFQLFADVLGPMAEKALKRWLSEGGDADPAWLVSSKCKGVIKHSPQAGGDGVWVNIEPAAIEELDQDNRDYLMAKMEQMNPELFAALFENATAPGEPPEDDSDLPF